MTITVRGADKVIANFQRLAKQYPREAERALLDECGIVLNESMKECPVETGLLRASSKVDGPFATPTGPVCIIGYYTDYAVYVHEIMENYHEPPTKAKFLEDPLYRHAEDFRKNMLLRLKEMIR